MVLYKAFIVFLGVQAASRRTSRRSQTGHVPSRFRPCSQHTTCPVPARRVSASVRACGWYSKPGRRARTVGHPLESEYRLWLARPWDKDLCSAFAAPQGASCVESDATGCSAFPQSKQDKHSALAQPNQGPLPYACNANTLHSKSSLAWLLWPRTRWDPAFPEGRAKGRSGRTSPRCAARRMNSDLLLNALDSPALAGHGTWEAAHGCSCGRMGGSSRRAAKPHRTPTMQQHARARTTSSCPQWTTVGLSCEVASSTRSTR